MKERLTNNLGLKILAIFLAFFVWLIVSNASNPLMQGSKDVTVEIINKEVLSENNLTYEVVGKSTVTVYYDVHTLDYYKIMANDFRAYADLSELYDVTGSIPIKIEVVNNASLISDPYTKPGVLQVKTEEIQRKRFDLRTIQQGEPEAGYELGEITMGPDFVYVTGAVSAIGQINSVGIEIKVDGATSDIAGKAVPKFYDANGNRLENLEDDVTLSVDEVNYQAAVLKVKALMLDYPVQGTVADGYRFTGVESDISSISVVGMKSTLASLTMLTIPSEMLSVEGATRDQVVKVDLAKLLPDHVTVAGTGETVATVTLKVEPLEIRGFDISTNDIELVGASEEYQYGFSARTVKVDIRGLSEDLDALNIKDMKPAVNVSSLTDGTHRAMLTLELGAGFEMLNYEGFDVVITLEGETEEEGESDSQESETTEADES